MSLACPDLIRETETAYKAQPSGELSEGETHLPDSGGNPHAVGAEGEKLSATRLTEAILFVGEMFKKKVL